MDRGLRCRRGGVQGAEQVAADLRAARRSGESDWRARRSGLTSSLRATGGMAMRHYAFSLALAALAAAFSHPASADTPVDLELILAVDVSRSMDPDEQALQRDGYMEAITHPDVIAAIGSGARHKIALSYVEWAG